MIKIGSEVFLTENVRTKMGFEDGLVWTVVDTLQDDFEYPYVASCKGFVEAEFFNLDELIEIVDNNHCH